MRTSTLTTLLELAGIVLLVVFAWFVWPPAALAVAGVSALVLAWSLERRPAHGGPVTDEDDVP